MPDYTVPHSLPRPLATDIIRGDVNDNLRLDIAALANATNMAITTEGARAVGAATAKVDYRLDMLEAVSTEPGTRLENLVMDPKPLNTVDTWQSGNVTLQQAPGFGRAIAAGGLATSVFSRFALGDGEFSRAPIRPGERVAARIDIRAMNTQRMSATLNIRGLAWNGATFTPTGNIGTSGQLHIEPDAVVSFAAEGFAPTSGTTHVDLFFTFRRYGETYPSTGDFVYFRRAMLATGPNADLPLDYVDGDSASAYWVGEPNASASIRLVTKGGGGGGEAALQRDAIVDAGIKRRSSKIGTGGKAAIALRFDHHFAQFNSKIMPLLRQHKLPWGQMVNIGRFGTGNDTLTPAQVASLCYTSGGELWNHGWSHSNITNKPEADREVTQGLSALKAAFPGLYIDGWAGPGQPDLMGMEGSDTPEKFYGTYPGQLVLQQHAFVRGYYPGIYQRMGLPNLIGAPHTTIDTLDFAYVSGLVRGAQASTAGLTLMLHPNYLDTPGYMTTAQLSQILAFIATERDAGELVVLSPTGILLADSSTSDRWNLVTSGAAGTLAGTWTQSITGRSAQGQYGVPHEAAVTVKANSAGSATLRVQVTHPGGVIDQSHALTLTVGQVATLRVPITPPLGTTSTVVTLTGTLAHSDIRFHAV